MAGRFGLKPGFDLYKNTSSLFVKIIFEPHLTLTATSFNICSIENECLRRMVGEQNWQPRPHPRMISTVPYVAAPVIKGTLL
jgi:hypothetical protein